MSASGSSPPRQARCPGGRRRRSPMPQPITRLASLLRRTQRAQLSQLHNHDKSLATRLCLTDWRKQGAAPVKCRYNGARSASERENAANVGGLREARDESRRAHGEARRSEEHTSELQSLAYLVCRLLLEKKKKKKCAIRA